MLVPVGVLVLPVGAGELDGAAVAGWAVVVLVVLAWFEPQPMVTAANSVAARNIAVRASAGRLSERKFNICLLAHGRDSEKGPEIFSVCVLRLLYAGGESVSLGRAT